jgi:hypothetical protein
VLAASIVMVALIALMMERESTSETSVNFYQTTRSNNPEESHLLNPLQPSVKLYVAPTLTVNNSRSLYLWVLYDPYYKQ